MLSLIELNAQTPIMTSPDVTVTSTNIINSSMRIATGIVQDGKDITAHGLLKIPVVFVRFADDNLTNTNWPVADEIPDWAETFLDEGLPSDNIYLNNNLSKYYDMASGGNGNGTLGVFQVIGDVFFISLPHDRSYYEVSTRRDQQVSKDVLDILDDPAGDFNVDFREYDNWEFKVGGVSYTHDYRPYNPSTGISADGILDFMLIY
jgi:hypothetical protein